MGKSLWVDRWAEWPDEEIIRAIRPDDDTRFEGHSKAILEYHTPKVTLDIGGGAGGLGKFLPGDYIVMDHPRIEQFCKEGRFVPIGPLNEIRPKPDLVVNINSWGETTPEIVADYIRQIEEVGIPYLYSVNRRYRQVNFNQYPLANWEPLLLQEHFAGIGTSYIQFMGRLK